MSDVSPMSNAPSYAALLTPRGRGAVATIRYEGDCAVLDAADPPPVRAVNGKPLAAQPPGRIVLARWGAETVEEVVLCRVAERELEIHCHGGEAAAARILHDLERLGCRVEDWPSAVTRREGLFDAECRQALTRATTLRAAQVLWEQASGLLRGAITALEAIPWTEAGWRALDNRLSELLRWSQFGLHLVQPWLVVLVGRPNVGKSTLMNALMGFARSIVYEQPGTTRDVVTGETALEGWPVRLADTAGMRAEADPLEAAGIERARQQLAAADCRVILLDTSRPVHADDMRLLHDWPDAVVAANKCDLPNLWGSALPAGALVLSAASGAGVEALAGRIAAKLVPEAPPAGTAVPVTQRQVELLRAAHAALRADDRGEFCGRLHELLQDRRPQ